MNIVSPSRDIFELPEAHRTDSVIVSVSGGKDSTALILALREREIPARYVFADTGWEAAPVYEYLNTLETLLGIQIERVSNPKGRMEDIIREQARFPSRRQRWCTRELKVLPIMGFHEKVRKETGEDTVSAVGIRRDESFARSEALGFEFNPESDWYTWRPLIEWSISDVLYIHNRHGVPVNPLYRLGFNRVGCMPCVMAGKSDVRLMAEHFPERVDAIRRLEDDATATRALRNQQTPGRYNHERATFFLSVKREEGITPIDRVVAWSKTNRKGLPMIEETPDSGCYRWGLCDYAPPPIPEK